MRALVILFIGNHSDHKVEKLQESFFLRVILMHIKFRNGLYACFSYVQINVKLLNLF